MRVAARLLTRWWGGRPGGPPGDRYARRAMATQMLRWRGGWARIAPWRAAGGVAHLSVGTDLPAPPPAVDRCLALLRAAGYEAVVTSALSPADSLPFIDAGFGVRERLHLLSHDLSAVAEVGSPTRRARRADRRPVLALDHAAFDRRWRLGGASGLEDALRATPVTRFRVAGGEIPAGYAITGLAATHGYLQRVGVDPAVQRRGWGRALVGDALRWLRRRGVSRALVNTQQHNAAALRLYEGCGFRQLPVGLCILGRAL
jgi:ribosomal protein S18 acetylase RimI-like enzyme